MTGLTGPGSRFDKALHPESDISECRPKQQADAISLHSLVDGILNFLNIVILNFLDGSGFSKHSYF